MHSPGRVAPCLKNYRSKEGPPIMITTEMANKALRKMNIEIILVGGNDIILAITHLVNCIIADDKIPNGCSLSLIINWYEGKGDILLRGNYRKQKLLDQVMKLMEHILATIIRTQLDIDVRQFCFMPERGTSDAIFILRQVHEKVSEQK